MGKGSRRVCGGATKRETHADESSEEDRERHTQRGGGQKRGQLQSGKLSSGQVQREEYLG